MRALQTGLVAVSALAALPGVALACPACLAASGEANRIAFLGTMVLMTSLPVLMIGGIIYWVARRSHSLDTDNTEHVADDAAEPPAPEARQGELVPLRRGY